MTDRKDPAHRAYIQSLPCAACNDRPPSECAHVRLSTFGETVVPVAERGGMGLKPDDKYSVPLCSRHHRIQHNMGEHSFWNTLDINPLALAQSLHRVTGNTLAGRNILLRYRNGATDL